MNLRDSDQNHFDRMNSIGLYLRLWLECLDVWVEVEEVDDLTPVASCTDLYEFKCPECGEYHQSMTIWQARGR